MPAPQDVIPPVREVLARKNYQLLLGGAALVMVGVLA